MTWSMALGILGAIALVSFIVFAFRQGMKVKKSPEGVPPERIQGGTL
jgi:hypothetical protein